MKDAVDDATGKIKYSYDGPGVDMKLHVKKVEPWSYAGPRTWKRWPCPLYRAKAAGTFSMGKNLAIELADIDFAAHFRKPSGLWRVEAPVGANLELKFSIPGKDLGLTGPLAGQMIRFCFKGESNTNVKWVNVNEEKMVTPPKLSDITGGSGTGEGDDSGIGVDP